MTAPSKRGGSKSNISGKWGPLNNHFGELVHGALLSNTKGGNVNLSLEESQPNSHSKLSEIEIKKGFAEAVNGKFFRKGQKNSWREELDSELKYKIERNLSKEMGELGYLN